MTLSRSKIFLIFCLSFIAGVLVSPLLTLPIMAIVAMIFVVIASLGWPDRRVVVIMFAGLLVLAGAWRLQMSLQGNDLAPLYDQKITATGQVCEEPDVRPDKVFLSVCDISIGAQAIRSGVLLYVHRFPEYTYGQRIKFTGKLARPKDAENPGDFSYKNYLSRFGIAGLVNYPQIEVLGFAGNPLKTAILQFKHSWNENLAQMLPEPQNALLGGLLLGAKRAIPSELTEAFNTTGTSHMIAISGYNITIIAAGIDWLLRRFFRKRVSFLISLVAIGMFVIMTGASASVIRAAIMGGLLLMALNVGRLYQINNALAFTAALMLAINPQVLGFDLGFQLSFAALLGIVYFSPLIEKFFSWVPNLIRPYLLATLGAQIGTLPILMHNFGRLSLIAPIANILVMPLVPITMLFGFLAGAVGLAWQGLAWPLVWIAWLFLTYIIRVIELLTQIPGASLNVSFNWYWFWGYVLVAVALLVYHYRKLWNASPNNS